MKVFKESNYHNDVPFDYLNEMIVDQVQFQKDLNLYLGADKVFESRDIALHIIDQCLSLLKQLPWESHRKFDNQRIIPSNVHQEIIDILKNWIILSNIWGLDDSSKIADEYDSRSSVIEQRRRQEIILESNKRDIVCVDIDGVLCDQIDSWLIYLEAARASSNNFRYKSNRRFINQLDLSTALYKADLELYPSLKNNYRESGFKRDATVIQSSVDFIKELKRAKIRVVLVSARPYYKYYRIFSDTLFWLNENNIQFDALIFEREKRNWVLENKDKVLLCLDDDPSQINKMKSVGINAILVEHMQIDESKVLASISKAKVNA